MTELNGVSFSYGGEMVLKDISIKIEDGMTYAVIGRTGSGKSTLMRHLNGLLRPVRGSVAVDGRPIPKKGAGLAAVRAHTGLVFQYPEHQLFAETVFDDIAFGPRNLGLGEEEVKKRVFEAAEAAGLPEGLFGRSPFGLSGGEQRRAAIAGVLAMRPRLLVLDEPAAGLDNDGKSALRGIIRRVRAADPKNSVVFVSHSMEDAAEADRIFVLGNGRVAAEGSPEEIFGSEEIIKKAGLTPPRCAELGFELKKRGIDIGGALTPEDAARAAAKYFV